ncbi:hypothetical protein Poly59_53320 [Rubripirellula reticaptiva]|uniref:Uncharacterized protein n=1 Tax=Rubripirellula reticaptiva TaxID=2528013 RepID=A0A5C6ECK3_9BACT|nr:hypothetical protein Poly59_53320 [Rubripirellula reticaptiva]
MIEENLQRSEIEREADRLTAGKRKPGMREHVLAWLLYCDGLPVDVRCPQCDNLMTVTPFPNADGATIQCECGLCSGSMRGL